MLAHAYMLVEEVVQVEPVWAIALHYLSGYRHDLLAPGRVNAWNPPLAARHVLNAPFRVGRIRPCCERHLREIRITRAAERYHVPFGVSRLEPAYVGDNLDAVLSEPGHDLSEVVATLEVRMMRPYLAGVVRHTELIGGIERHDIRSRGRDLIGYAARIIPAERCLLIVQDILVVPVDSPALLEPFAHNDLRFGRLDG